MDAIELLSRLGQVEPADQAVLDEALSRFHQSQFTRAADQGRRTSRRSRLLLAAGGAVAVAAAAAVVLPGVTRPSPRARPAPVSSTSATSRPPSSLQGRPGVGATLSAFVSSKNDILRVTKTMAGPEGTLGKTIIWIDPAQAGRGDVVHSRILNFTLAGARELDLTLRYTEPRSRPAVCEGFFERPRIEKLPAPGLRGAATIVYYSGRLWARSAVAVQAATVPSADSLRACLGSGYWRNLGPGVLGGTKTTEFAATGTALAGAGYEHLWVDAVTALPVRLVSFNGEEKITFNFRFLSPTPANKALLRLRIPPGFVRRGI